MQAFKRTFNFIFTHPLGKRHPVRALLRLIGWQLQHRLNPSQLIIKSFIPPVKFYAKRGLTGITGNIYTGLHEFNDMAFLLHFLRASDTFMDIGANVGSYTLLSSGVCQAKTIALEPSTDTADLLNRNLALNRLQQKVTLIQAAAGARRDIRIFSKNQDTTNHIMTPGEHSTTDFEQVEVIRIDDLTLTDKPILIKIDVEGFETEVLQGMADTLKQTQLKAIIIELNGSGARYGFHDDAIHDLLISHDFKPYDYHPFTRSLQLRNVYGSYNTIYCRNMAFVNNRLKTGPGFKTMGETI
jgi:FkbM family methyltransferase